MSPKTLLHELKDTDLNAMDVTLALVKEYKQRRISRYSVKYIPIDKPLESRLRGIITDQLSRHDTVSAYSFDCPEPEPDQLRAIDYHETDFPRIFGQLLALNPEEDVIEDIDELVKARAYLIVLRNEDGIQVTGFKTLPESWKMRRTRGLIPLLYRGKRFVDLEEENVFSIASTVDLIHFKETLFIHSKKEFERGLNFRDGMMAKARELYEEIKDLDLFVNMDLLLSKVGNNQRYLRKIALIKDLGYYRNPKFLSRMRRISRAKDWDIRFENGQIAFTDDTLDTILSILQNKRLYSEMTEEDFDVDGKIDAVG
ncbi:Kiwa anti-phage protein KwaB-like domain-containing protein [Compostibacter hankyongensis]|uniref:DUF4868 domain-containing protein n=1 Tax=Compostibacter hankyongensis TaxID=1007089 RepID=A0ABP8G5T9_9BACT